MDRHHLPSLLFPLAIIMAGVCVYANSLSGPFIFDDVPAIAKNTHIRQLLPLSRSLTAPPGTGASSRPVVCLSLALNYAFCGLDVVGYHTWNIGVHILAALALFGLIRRASAILYPKQQSTVLAGIVSLIWVVHPLPSDALNHMIYRHEAMMSLFYVTTLYCAFRYFAKPRALWAMLAICCAALGMGSKENMISLPIVVWMIDAMLISRHGLTPWRKHTLLHVGLFSTWIVLYLSVTSGYRGEAAGYDISYLPVGNYIITQFSVWTYYLRLAVWPTPLVIDYDDWPVATSLFDVWPHILVVAALLGATLVSLWKRHWCGIAGIIYVGVLAPTTVIPNAGEILAEHRMYLPLMIVILAIMSAIRYASRHHLPKVRSLAGVMAIATSVSVVALGYATIDRNRDYGNDVTIWEDTIAKRPGNGRAHNNLAEVLVRQGRIHEAKPLFEQAIERKVGYALAHNNLANIHQELGDIEKARHHYEQAIAARPNYAGALCNLGALHFEQRQYAEAAECYRQSLAIEPTFVEALNNLGLLYAVQGQFSEAKTHFERSLEQDPWHAQTNNNLGIILLREQQPGRAAQHFTVAIESRPNFAQAHNNLGRALEQQGNVTGAIVHYRRALEIRPEFSQAKRNLEKALTKKDA